VKLTTPEPFIAHTALDAASTDSVTAVPDVLVAVGVYVAPPTVAFVGALDVNVIVCVALATVKLCVAEPGW
jgi:hypothetical protein